MYILFLFLFYSCMWSNCLGFYFVMLVMFPKVAGIDGHTR